MSPTRTQSASLLDGALLASRIGAKRRSQGLSQRAAASAIGVSASTLSRIERGGHLPHREPLLRIARWLDVPIELAADIDSDTGERVHPAGISPVEAVELHLRADPDLSSPDAETLIATLHLLYQRFKQRSMRASAEA